MSFSEAVPLVRQGYLRFSFFLNFFFYIGLTPCMCITACCYSLTIRHDPSTS
uniref:Uncharacterized protein n=1 Tax=Anguilla anguilla TaxID=7936 RepID=A0A0E9R3F9_ANGAN